MPKVSKLVKLLNTIRQTLYNCKTLITSRLNKTLEMAFSEPSASGDDQWLDDDRFNFDQGEDYALCAATLWTNSLQRYSPGALVFLNAFSVKLNDRMMWLVSLEPGKFGFVMRLRYLGQ